VNVLRGRGVSYMEGGMRRVKGLSKRSEQKEE
jgi:hypothetical protein